MTSQESSALWIGRLEPASWELVDHGTVYEFPRDRKGRAIYCLVEGVSWINSASGQEQFVVVSDRAKSGTGTSSSRRTSSRCRQAGPEGQLCGVTRGWPWRRAYFSVSCRS